MKRRKTTGNVEDSQGSAHGSNAEEATAENISSNQTTSSSGDGSRMREAEERPVTQSRKQKQKITNIDQASAEIMTLLGEMREELHRSRNREKCQDNIAGFLRSLEYDIRQIPQHNLSALKIDIMQVVQHYLNMQPASSSHPENHYNAT